MASSRISGMSALIVGATGATGKLLLQGILSSNAFTRVGEYGRRLTPHQEVEVLRGRDKLEQNVIDFENLENSGLKGGRWDVIFITLGTSRDKAGSAEAFEKIDREYVLNVARAAKTDDQDHQQRVVYLSGNVADPASHVLYTRSKGLTEYGLVNMGYSDVIAFRPGFIAQANRAEPAVVEKLYAPVAGFLARYSSGIQISACTLAESMRIAGELGSPAIPANVKATKTTAGRNGAPYTVISNASALALAATAQGTQ